MLDLGRAGSAQPGREGEGTFESRRGSLPRLFNTKGFPRGPDGACRK